MAEDKVNTGTADQVPGERENTVTPPETNGGGPSAHEGDEVVVNFDTIDRLMAARRVAAREEAEQGSTASSHPGPEEKQEAADPPLPGDGDGAALIQEVPTQPGEQDPTPKVSGTSTKVIDFTASGGPKETAQAPEAEQGKKPRRGRPPKDKGAPTAERSGKTRKERQPKTDKPAPEQGKGGRDKVSQSKGGRKQEAPTIGGSGSHAVEQETPAPPRPVENQKIVYLKVSELHPFHTFRDHPFSVDEREPRVKEIIASVKERGVISPATVRPEKDGNGYEIVAGHCRCRASELAGYTELPCIIREMSDHEAVQEMKDSNKQRGPMLPMEMARLLDLELEDIKHQGARPKGAAEADLGKRSSEIVGEAHGLNYKKVTQYIRLNHLIPELQTLVDGVLDDTGKRSKRMGFMPAVELSYVRPKNQQLIAVSMDSEQVFPSVSQAKRLRELDEKNLLNGDVIDQILCEQKKEVDQVIISAAELNKYFGEDKTPRQMKEQIIALLDEWKAKQPPEKNAPEQAAER